jgi:hypothetical protein
LEVSAYRSDCVGFLDPLLRDYLQYSFQEMNPSELFVSTATIREYDNDSDRLVMGKVLFIDSDGRVVIDSYKCEPPGGVSKLIAQEERHTDVSDLWEPYPEFGNYEGLSRIRNIPHLHL